MDTEELDKYLSAAQNTKEPFGPNRLELEYSEDELYSNPMSFDTFIDLYQYRIYFDNPCSDPEYRYNLYGVYAHGLELLDDFVEQEKTIKEIHRDVIKTMISDPMGYIYLGCQNESDFIRRIYERYFMNQIVTKTKQFKIFKSINHLINELLVKLDVCDIIINQMLEKRDNPNIRFFSTDLDENQLVQIKDLLVMHGYLEECSNNNFLYYFGCQYKYKERPLKWNKKKQSLANIMHMICKTKCDRLPAIKYAFDYEKFDTKQRLDKNNYTDNDTNEIEKEIKVIMSNKSCDPSVS